MKVGMITFHRALNYGAILQTYALQTALAYLNVDSEVIDYRCQSIEKAYRQIFINGTFRNKVRHILVYPNLKRRDKMFSSFISDYLHLSREHYSSSEELEEINDNYDSFITGSDQVWNQECTNFDSAFFLDFVKDEKEKISYAASFGVSELSKKNVEKYKTLLQNFNGISVRENQGSTIVRNLINREASVNIDPTLLLSQNDWEDIAIRPEEQDYILIYHVYRSKSLINFAVELSRLTNLKIVYICDGIIRPIEAEYVTRAGPEEFVGYIANAKYVITNSFHGLAFSVIWHKLFFIELLKPSHMVNSRLENILDLLGLRDRQIIEGNNQNMDKPIDYVSVDKIIEEEREKSMDYLIHALSLSHE